MEYSDCVFVDAMFASEILRTRHLPTSSRSATATTQTSDALVHQLSTQWPDRDDAQCGTDQDDAPLSEDSELTALLLEEAEQRCANLRVIVTPLTFHIWLDGECACVVGNIVCSFEHAL
jgi:hypothetical protein